MTKITSGNIFMMSLAFLLSGTFFFPLATSMVFDYLFLDNYEVLTYYIYFFSTTLSLMVFNKRIKEPNFDFYKIFDFIVEERKHLIFYTLLLMIFGIIVSNEPVTNTSSFSISYLLTTYLSIFSLGVVSLFFSTFGLYKDFDFKLTFSKISENIKSLASFSLIVLFANSILPKELLIYSLTFGFYFLTFFNDSKEA